MPAIRWVDRRLRKACRHCRLHKRRCDKRMPKCTRCSMKLIRCDYDDDAPIEVIDPNTTLMWSEPLAIQRGSCGLELSPAGEKELLWAAFNSYDTSFGASDARVLMTLVKDIFAYGGTSVEQVTDSYFIKAYNWIPIVDETKIRMQIQSIFDIPRVFNTLALLLLCMFLMNQQPCHHPGHSPNSVLYRTAKRVFLLLETPITTPCSLDRLQAGLLLASYECGHGMTEEATSTLGSCFGLIRQLEMHARQGKALDERYYDLTELSRKLCWNCIVFLDRSIVLSCADGTAALLLPTSEMIPPHAILNMNLVNDDRACPIAKFRTRATSALLIGEAIEDVDCDPECPECVESETLLHQFIRQHAATAPGELYPICESVTMALSAAVSTYKNKARRLGSAPDAKLNLDIKFAYNIVFEMCRVEGSVMRRRNSASNRMCFSGLGCLYRAAVDLDDVYPKGAAPEDVRQLRENLEWFSGHWKIADVLLQRLNENAQRRASLTCAICVA